MRWHSLSVILALVISASAGIVEDVRGALAQNSFSTAESELKAYRAQNGTTAEYAEAYSWLARAALASGNYEQSEAYAKETKASVAELLKQRSLDAEPHLPIALGAAIEVQAQTFAAQGKHAQAIATLQTALRTYGNTSIRARLQKNLNLLSFEGQPAPAIRAEQFLGSKPAGLGPIKGFARAAFFLGTLVWRLQSRGAYHHATSLGVCSQGISGDWSHKAIWLYGASRACLAHRRARLYRCGAASLLWRAIGHACADQQVRLRRLWRLDHAYFSTAGSRGKGGDVPPGSAAV